MANQIIVTNTGNVQVAIEPTPNVQVQISRAAIGTVSNVPTANYANYAGEAFDVSVANVSGIGNIAVVNLNGNAQTVLQGDGTFGPSGSNSANYANYANFAGTVTNASQPNITSLGTITGLTSSGNISAPYFIGNVVGNISGNLVVPGTNTSVLFNQEGNAGASDAFQFNYATNVATILGNLSATNISGNGAGLSNITGANVNGTVANATYATNAGTAYSVSGSNVSGDVSGANHANIADSANSVAGANVSGAVNLATYATTANSVALANVSGAGNIASLNLDGSSSNVLYGNGTFAAIPTISNVANANYANFAGQVVDATQSNITTLGTLTNVITSGQITSTGAGNASDGGGQLYLNGSGNNRIDYNTNGTGAPTTTTRSAGTKVTLYPALSTTQTDYAMGIDAATMWSSVPVSDPSFKFKWYGNTTEIANLDGTGNFTVAGNISGTNINGNVANANYANFAGTAYSVSGANVSGEVANANYATYAGTAYSVSGSNVSGEVANANYATFAGTAYSVNGSNVSGDVSGANHANVADTANSVSVGNVSGIGNIATINLDGNASNILHGDGSFGPEAGNLNANYANFAGQVVDATQSNITLLGTLTSLDVSGNANINGTLIMSATTTGQNDIVGVENGSNATQRGLRFQGGNVTNPGVASGQPAGAFTLNGGSATSPTDLGTTWNATSGGASITGGPAYTANGAATSGSFTLSAGVAITENTGRAQGGNVSISSGSAFANANTANSGNITISTNSAGSNGVARSGTISLQIGNANGATGNTYGNINIGTLETPDVYSAPASINIGQANTPTVIGGNVSALNANLGNLAIANFFSGDGGLLSNIAVANVSGLGNIATLNLDGNASNLLTGAGTYVAIPTVSANANYANFAGQVVDATQSNITLLGTLTSLDVSGNLSSGNANLGNLAIANFFSGDGGLLSNITAANVVGSLPVRFEVKNTSGGTLSKGTPVYVTGTVGATIVLEVAASRADTSSTMGCIGLLEQDLTVNSFGYAVSIGTLTQYDTSAFLVGQEIYVAPTGGITNVRPTNNNIVQPIGTVGRVSATTGSIEINIWDIVSLPNLENGNIWVGNSSNGYPVQAVLSTANVGNSNYAAYAGNVTLATQPNITSTGNLVSLNINNGVAGSTTKQFAPNGVTIISTANANLMSNSSFVDIDYGNGQGDGNVLLGKSTTYLKARGNASSLVSANVSDRVGRTNYSFYNGTSNVLAAATQVNPGAGVTFNTNANAITTAGQYAIITGNPNGDQGNANALSNQNLYTFDPFGRLSITQGAAGSTSIALNINTYGGSGGNAAAGAQTIFFSRARGNRDGNLSVQPNDQLGGLLFAGHNGTSTFATRTATIRAVVDSSYVANTANIPAGLQFITCDNTTSYTHQFYANGNVVFNGGKTVTAGYFYGDGGNLTGINATNANYANFAGTVVGASQPNITSVANSFSSGQLNLNATGAGGPQLNINGNSTAGNTGSMTLNDAGLSVNIDGANYPGGAPSFAFSTYQTGGSIPPQFYKRYNGTPASPTGVATGDQILNQYYQVYGDSGNTNLGLGGILARVGNVYSPGNISFNYQIYSSGNPADKIDIDFATINLNGNVTANNISTSGNANIGNLQLNRFQETVYSIGSTSGSITPDFNNGSIQSMTLTGSITMNTLANASAGRSMTLIVTQGGTGSYTLTSSMKFQGNNRTLSTAVGAIDIISVFYDGSTYYATLSTGYA